MSTLLFLLPFKAKAPLFPLPFKGRAGVGMVFATTKRPIKPIPTQTLPLKGRASKLSQTFPTKGRASKQ